MTQLARDRYGGAQDEGRRLTWLVAWFCRDAAEVLAALRTWLSETEDAAEADQRMVLFCAALVDHHSLRFGGVRRDFERVEILRELLPLVYSHVRLEADAVHDGVYTPDSRDHAESTRGYLLERLWGTPGQGTYVALVALASEIPDPKLRRRMAVLAHRRAAADAEPEAPWQPSDVAEFAATAERDPRTARELYNLTLDRLDDLKGDLEEGDASEASLLQRAGDESEVRTWFANRLRQAARGRYSVPPEEELADGTRPDLRIHGTGIDAPVSLELKIADNWSYAELAERLRNQLVGQYLRDDRSRHGVYLLTWHGRKQHWVDRESNQSYDFEELIDRLQEEADETVLRNGHVDGLKVIGIDLVRRHLSSAETRRAAVTEEQADSLAS